MGFIMDGLDAERLRPHLYATATLVRAHRSATSGPSAARMIARAGDDRAQLADATPSLPLLIARGIDPSTQPADAAA